MKSNKNITEEKMRPGGKRRRRVYRIVYGAEIKGSASVTRFEKKSFTK